MTRLIDADELKSKVLKEGTSYILTIIDNAPTVIPEEFKPLIDKVVDILPELTSAVIEQLPQIISSNIKCSECSYYKDTWNVIPRPQGKWEVDNLRNTICNNCGGIRRDNRTEHIAFCNRCGADMRGDGK